MRLALPLLVWCFPHIACAERWVDTYSTGSFRVRSEVPLGKYKQILAYLPQHKRTIEQALSLQPGKMPVTITIYRSWWVYRQEVIRRLGKAVSNPALFIKAKNHAFIYCYARRELASDILHETTHAVLHSSLPYVPIWLDEGLAVYFQALPQDREKRNPHLGRIRWNVWFGLVPNLRKLEQNSTISDLSAAEYRDSWSWVHFLLHESQASKAVLVKYLAQIRSGNPPGRFSVFLAKQMANSRQRYKDHFQNKKPK